MSVPPQTHSPAFFTFGARSIAAQHSNFEPLADPAAVPGGRPGRPGDSIILYGTGFGPTVPAIAAGELADRPAPLPDPVSITVGGVPATVRDGDLPVLIQIGSARSQAGVSIPVREPKLLRVPGDFTTIQAAVNAANPGDVVQVAAGRCSGTASTPPARRRTP